MSRPQNQTRRVEVDKLTTVIAAISRRICSRSSWASSTTSTKIKRDNNLTASSSLILSCNKESRKRFQFLARQTMTTTTTTTLELEALANLAPSSSSRLLILLAVAYLLLALARVGARQVAMQTIPQQVDQVAPAIGLTWHQITRGTRESWPKPERGGQFSSWVL